MNEIPKVSGEELVHFFEAVGCNLRHEVGEHSVMWSVFTGDFFVVPTYDNELLDKGTLEHLIWQVGLTEQAFFDMWKEYISKNQ